VAHTYNSCYSGEDLKFEASLRQIVHETLSWKPYHQKKKKILVEWPKQLRVPA
jgi:hypothetical protein